MTGSLILKIDSPTNLWFFHLIKENVHYKTVNPDLSNLIDTIETVIKEEERSKRIAIASYTLVSKFMNKRCLLNIINDILWQISLYTQYHDIQTYTSRRKQVLYKYLKYINKYIKLKDNVY